MQRQVRRESQQLHQGLRQLEGDPGAAEVLLLRRAVGAARIEHRVRRRQLGARQVVIGHDDIDAGGTGGGDGGNGRDAAVTGDDHLRADALRFGKAGRPKIIAIANPVRHERIDRRARAPQDPSQHRRRALAVHVVVAVHQDRPLLADRADQQLHRSRHVGQAMRIAQALQVGPQEGFRGIGRC